MVRRIRRPPSFDRDLLEGLEPRRWRAGLLDLGGPHAMLVGELAAVIPRQGERDHERDCGRATNGTLTRCSCR